MIPYSKYREFGNCLVRTRETLRILLLEKRAASDCEHFSHDQGSLGRPKELEMIAGSGGQGCQLFSLGSYVTGLYRASGPLQIFRELESHLSDQKIWDTRDQIDTAEFSLRGYRSNLALISGGTSGAETKTEVPEKPSPKKKR